MISMNAHRIMVGDSWCRTVDRDVGIAEMLRPEGSRFEWVLRWPFGLWWSQPRTGRGLSWMAPSIRPWRARRDAVLGLTPTTRCARDSPQCSTTITRRL